MAASLAYAKRRATCCPQLDAAAQAGSAFRRS